MLKIYGLFALIVIVVVLGFGSSYTIDQGERGVLTRNGAVVGLVEPGLGFKTPLITSVTEVSVQNQTQSYENLQAYSYDQQPAGMDVSVSYHIPVDKVVELYTQYGSIERLVSRDISRQVPTQLENIFGQFSASEVVQNRAKFVQQVTDAIRQSVSKSPVIIDSVQIENIEFKPSYDQLIQQKMAASIEVTKKQQELQSAKIQAQIQITQAQALADSQLAIATAKAKATQIQGEADAIAIKAKSDALNTNPQLVALTAAEKWDGKLPTTMVPGQTVPFLPVK